MAFGVALGFGPGAGTCKGDLCLCGETFRSDAPDTQETAVEEVDAGEAWPEQEQRAHQLARVPQAGP